MGLNIHVAEQVHDRGYRTFLKELVDRDMIKNQAALGITKMILCGRSWDLTIKQSKVFTNLIFDRYKDRRCRKCKTYIDWYNFAEAICNGYRCRKCL
jgi:hypothetical protein